MRHDGLERAQGRRRLDLVVVHAHGRAEQPAVLLGRGAVHDLQVRDLVRVLGDLAHLLIDEQVRLPVLAILGEPLRDPLRGEGLRVALLLVAGAVLRRRAREDPVRLLQQHHVRGVRGAAVLPVPAAHRRDDQQRDERLLLGVVPDAGELEDDRAAHEGGDVVGAAAVQRRAARALDERLGAQPGRGVDVRVGLAGVPQLLHDLGERPGELGQHRPPLAVGRPGAVRGVEAAAAVGLHERAAVEERQRVPEPERGLEAGEQVGHVGVHGRPVGHLERVEPQRRHLVVPDGEHEQVVEVLEGGQPAVVVQGRVDRLDDGERHPVAAQLPAQVQRGVGLAGPGRADDEAVPGQVRDREPDVAPDRAADRAAGRVPRRAGAGLAAEQQRRAGRGGDDPHGVARRDDRDPGRVALERERQPEQARGLVAVGEQPQQAQAVAGRDAAGRGLGAQDGVELPAAPLQRLQGGEGAHERVVLGRARRPGHRVSTEDGLRVVALGLGLRGRAHGRADEPYQGLRQRLRARDGHPEAEGAAVVAPQRVEVVGLDDDRPAVGRHADLAADVRGDLVGLGEAPVARGLGLQHPAQRRGHRPGGQLHAERHRRGVQPHRLQQPLPAVRPAPERLDGHVRGHAGVDALGPGEPDALVHLGDPARRGHERGEHLADAPGLGQRLDPHVLGHVGQRGRERAGGAQGQVRVGLLDAAEQVHLDAPGLETQQAQGHGLGLRQREELPEVGGLLADGTIEPLGDVQAGVLRAAREVDGRGDPQRHPAPDPAGPGEQVGGGDERAGHWGGWVPYGGALCGGALTGGALTGGALTGGALAG
ncbi:hypothetical protein ACQP1P_25245 [Dactylosporangium sp. CA-052675]|uniref:hypothetical protein n=1 Tax=Dactylosporangium sp. CA-052675 TaxID=3239927 RepID=UPI003D8D6A2D